MTDLRRLAATWHNRAHESQRVHYAAADRYRRLHVVLGVPTIVITSIIGTAVLASLQKERGAGIGTIALGMLSIGAAILSALQTFLGFAERSERHRKAGAAYATLKRQLEFLLASEQTDQDAASMTAVQRAFEQLGSDSPAAPGPVFEHVRAMLRQARGDSGPKPNSTDGLDAAGQLPADRATLPE